mgnify:FL=1
MAKKTNERDVLIVRDEKTGEISVVAGLNADGTPKRVPAKAENTKDFMTFDRHGDVIDNFFKNFYRQCKEPYRFGFYRIAAEQADKLIDAMKELLKDPVANAELLAPHKVDTSEYVRAVSEEEKQDNHNQQTPNEENMQENNQQPENGQETPAEKRGYQPIDESKIDWNKFEAQYGLTRDDLVASKSLDKMLNYRKSEPLTVRVEVLGERQELGARLELKRLPDGSVDFVPDFVRKEARLDEPHKGHTFTDEEKKALQQTGNLGRVVDLVDKETGETIPSFISIDRFTNKIEDVPANKVRITDKIGKTEISETEQALLRSGGYVRKEIELANGRKFPAILQVSAIDKGVEFVPRNARIWQGERQGQRNGQRNGQKENKPQENRQGQEQGERKGRAWVDENGNIKPIGKWKGVEFSEQQKADYVSGKTVRLENVPDDKGNPATIYIKFNHEKGRPFRYDNNPDTAQKVAPSNESRTQIAVNNEGKTNEATKHVKEPLQQGQTAPANERQQRQQNKPKGQRL